MADSWGKKGRIVIGQISGKVFKTRSKNGYYSPDFSPTIIKFQLFESLDISSHQECFVKRLLDFCQGDFLNVFHHLELVPFLLPSTRWWGGLPANKASEVQESRMANMLISAFAALLDIDQQEEISPPAQHSVIWLLRRRQREEIPQK